VLVHDEFEDIDGRKRRVLNPVETTAAQEKADALSERFAEWVWEDPERARGLVTEYNRRFNSIVLRDYTDAGNYLTLPGRG
jgi:N12 class adenine-specific DNA methylase